MHQVRNKSKGAACALRVLRSGKDELGKDGRAHARHSPCR
jgi:hypothetical protein